MTATIATRDCGTWFERIRQEASPAEFYSLIHMMPKGADLHVHLSGCGTADDWYEIASRYEPGIYIRPEALDDLHLQEPASVPRWALGFQSAHGWLPLGKLSPEQRARWQKLVTLQRPSRTKFFIDIPRQLKHLRKSAEMIELMLMRSICRAAYHGLFYLEILTGPFGYRDAYGHAVPIDNMATMYARCVRSGERLGVHVRFLVNVSRTADNVEERLRASFRVAHDYPGLWVGVNLSGDEERGRLSVGQLEPLYEKLRAKYPTVGIAIHAGEGFGPEYLVGPALRLGPQRIGHALNLVNEADVATEIVRSGVCVETSLISSQQLQHVLQVRHHPVRQLINRGCVVSLCTDNPGVWGSSIVDEYYLAAGVLGLSWTELKTIARSGIAASFAPSNLKIILLQDYDQAIDEFENRLLGPHWRANLGDLVEPSLYARRCMQIDGAGVAS